MLLHPWGAMGYTGREAKQLFCASHFIVSGGILIRTSEKRAKKIWLIAGIAVAAVALMVFLGVLICSRF